MDYATEQITRADIAAFVQSVGICHPPIGSLYYNEGSLPSLLAKLKQEECKLRAKLDAITLPLQDCVLT